MDLRAFLREWSQEATECGFQSEVFAEVAGYPLLASRKGPSSKPCIYLSAGMHGDEPAGSQALLALLKEGFFDDRFHWLICPVLNPTGLAAETRENANGIDLNRDYCLCETEEVCAHISWLKMQKVPGLFLSLHEDWEASGFYFYEINTGRVDSDHQGILDAAGIYFSPEPSMVIDDHEVTAPGWIFHSEHPDLPEGWPEAIFLAKMGCPLSLTFETPSGRALADRVGCHQAVVREAVSRCLS